MNAYTLRRLKSVLKYFEKNIEYVLMIWDKFILEIFKNFIWYDNVTFAMCMYMCSLAKYYLSPTIWFSFLDKDTNSGIERERLKNKKINVKNVPKC